LKKMVRTKMSLGALVILSVISFVIPLSLMTDEVVPYILFFLFLSFVVSFMMTVFQDLNGKVEKDRFIVLLLSFLIVIVFWGAFEQAGGLMNIYAEQKANRMVFGYEVPAAVMQFFNPFYIIALGIPVAGFWIWVKRKGKEATSIFKMGVGVIIMGLGFIFMVFASLQYNEFGESALIWLILAYLLHTIGELCASPVALSFITKLAPLRYGALMMGVYFAATGLGNKVAGIIGESAESAGDLKVFTTITILCVAFGILVILLLKPLKRLTHGAEDKKVEGLEQEGFELADKEIDN